MKNKLRRFWHALLCTLGQHDWESVYGCMVVRCTRCGHEHINR